MDAGTRAIGVASATILLVTLLWQLRCQWKKGSSEGVSRFLFVGQMAASTGFAIYSAMIGDPVFVVTNVALGIAAIAGLAITLLLRRRSRSWQRRATDRPGAASRHGVDRVGA